MKSHIEVVRSFVAKFKTDCQKTCSKIARNPFTDQLFRKVNSSFIFPAIISDSAGRVFDISETQYSNFVQKRFVIGSANVINAPVHHNILKLPKDAATVCFENPNVRLN